MQDNRLSEEEKSRHNQRDKQPYWKKLPMKQGTTTDSQGKLLRMS